MHAVVEELETEPAVLPAVVFDPDSQPAIGLPRSDPRRVRAGLLGEDEAVGVKLKLKPAENAATKRAREDSNL